MQRTTSTGTRQKFSLANRAQSLNTNFRYSKHNGIHRREDRSAIRLFYSTICNFIVCWIFMTIKHLKKNLNAKARIIPLQEEPFPRGFTSELFLWLIKMSFFAWILQTKPNFPVLKYLFFWIGLFRPWVGFTSPSFDRYNELAKNSKWKRSL